MYLINYRMWKNPVPQISHGDGPADVKMMQNMVSLKLSLLHIVSNVMSCIHDHIECTVVQHRHSV